MMNDEVFFDEQGVKITNTQLIVLGKSIDVSNISTIGSVKNEKPKRLWPIILIIVGLLMFAISKTFAVILLIIGIIWLLKQKRIHYVYYDNSSTGKRSTIENLDDNFIERLYAALQKSWHNSEQTGEDINEDDDEQSNNEVVSYSFENAVKDVENLSSESVNREELEDEYFDIFVNAAVTVNMTVEEKCKVLELLSKKLKIFYAEEKDRISKHFQFNINGIRASYKILIELYRNQSADVSDALANFDSDFKTGLKDFNYYLGDIFMFAGLLRSQDGKFSVDSQILEKYELPSGPKIKEGKAYIN